MSYASRGSLGFQKWGVTNPWVWANLAQPQRQRGNVSPMVFQTAGPYLKSAHLGLTPEEELKRADRMEKIAITGLVMSTASLWLGYQFYKERRMVANRKKRRPRRRRRTSR
jgi:hypothetical protein